MRHDPSDHVIDIRTSDRTARVVGWWLATRPRAITLGVILFFLLEGFVVALAWVCFALTPSLP